MLFTLKVRVQRKATKFVLDYCAYTSHDWTVYTFEQQDIMFSIKCLPDLNVSKYVKFASPNTTANSRSTNLRTTLQEHPKEGTFNSTVLLDSEIHFYLIKLICLYLTQLLSLIRIQTFFWNHSFSDVFQS